MNKDVKTDNTVVNNVDIIATVSARKVEMISTSTYQKTVLVKKLYLETKWSL